MGYYQGIRKGFERATRWGSGAKASGTISGKVTSMEVDPAADLVLRWAHAAAKAAATELLDERHILAAFAVLCNKKETSLSPFIHGIQWPVDSYRTARKIEKLPLDGKPATIPPRLMMGFLNVHTHFEGIFTCDDLLEMILYKEDHPLVSELLAGNGADKMESWIKQRWALRDDAASGHTEKVPAGEKVSIEFVDRETTSRQAGEGGTPGSEERDTAGHPGTASQPQLPLELSLWDSLNSAHSHRCRLGKPLFKAVLGQEVAVDMLTDAYFSQTLRWDASAPRGMFTFIGPPGVGKTLLAESFAAAVAKIESKAVAFKRFDMSGYAHRHDFIQLFGTETFWMGNQPGALTSFVKENPSAVLLFDEIEKAHPTVIQSLLPVLDSGKALDKNLKEIVSFSGCWLLFTTNLGRELWNTPQGLGILRGGTDSKDLAWDLLAKARPPDRGEGDVPALSPEFVSRLAKGGAVLFKPLGTESLQAIVNRAVEEEFLKIYGSHGLKTPEVKLDPSACRLFLLSQGPRIDARRAASQGAEWALSILDEARACAPDPPPAKFPQTVLFRCEPKAQAYLDKKLGAHRPNVLLMDDDDYLVSGLQQIADSFGGTFRRISRTQDVELGLGQRLPDVVLLDMSIDERPASFRADSGLAFLALLRERLPHVPVYLFSENPDRRGMAFRSVIMGVLKQGWARDFFPCYYKKGQPKSLEPFFEQVRMAVDHWRFDALMRDHQRANVTVNAGFRCSMKRKEILRVDMALPLETRAPSLPDILKGNFYQGIPQERFDDLIGIARAKDRLRSVLDWLKDPTLLGRFGLRPPRGYLLSGPPGTGKTMLAKALAGEARLPFLAVSASDLSNRLAGETERLISELFEQADRYAPSIIFVDEIDALGADRGTSSGKGGRAPLSQLLVCMDGVQSPSRPVFVLGATNDADSLDRALCRPGRFDEVIKTDMPNQEARKAFFERRLKSLPWEGPCDIAQLALSAWLCTPAELDRMIRETAYMLAKEGRAAFTQADLLKMIHFVQYGASSPDQTRSEEQKRNTAWHEAGHAVVTRFLLPFRRLDYLTIIPSDRGYTGLSASVMEEENRHSTAKEILSYMAVSMGGRAAEMKLRGGLEGVNSGCSSDLARAANRAYEAITSLGLDPEFGPVGLSGLPSSAQGNFQSKAADRVRLWTEEAEKAAKKILDEHADKLEALAEALLKAETMDAEAIEKVLG